MLRLPSHITPEATVIAAAVGAASATMLIPPLRKFTWALATSKHHAVRYLGGKLQGLATGVVGIAGLIRLSTLAAPWILRHAPASVQRLAKDDVKLILLTAFSVALYKNFDFPVWQETLQPTKVSDAPFFGTQVIVQKRENKWYFMPSADGKTPGLDVQFVIKHAMAYYGMTLSSYIYNSLTIGMLEYPRNIINRIFRHYGGLQPQCNVYTSPENFYRGVMNTSMACWMNSETGNLDFWNLRLVYNDTDTIVVDHIEIFLDHDNQVFLKMEIDGKTETNPEQASIIAQIIFAIYTHPQVHWWANGARQLEGLWQSARESGDVTQWMNMASTYISWIFIGNSAKTMAGIISHNVNNGLPFHFSELHQKVAVNSKAHSMAVEVRKQMAAKYPTWTESQINSLLASTLYHSTDHYYTSYYMSWASQSKYLMHDASLFRLALFAPNKYYTRKLLCAERLDDPICKLIYDAAVKVDAVFANTALYIGCAN